LYRIIVRMGGLGAALALLAAACAPVAPPTIGPGPAPAAGLPAIPRVDGPLDIRVVHPTPTMARPSADSTIVYGSVGTGAATLTINDRRVEVQPNGAFLAFVPVPADGTYRLAATAGGRTVTATRSYRAPAAAVTPTPAPALVEFPQPRLGVVTGGADTLRTGSDVAIGRTTPTGTFRWFLPRGARLAVTGQQGEMLRVRMDDQTAWFPANTLTLEAGTPPAPGPIGVVGVEPAGDWVDVRMPVSGAPFLVQPEADRLLVTVYGRTPPTVEATVGDRLLTGIAWQTSAGGGARAEIRLAQALLGFKSFYDANGDLVVRVRRPPPLNQARPLTGLRIAIDPGHPPAGATGPTGLTEADANLAISLPLERMLRERGAEVFMTRRTQAPMVSATDAAVELRARTRFAADNDVHLLVSVHNNAFPEGVDPWRAAGTSTYFYHPFAATFARLVNEELVRVTYIRDLGPISGNLAAARPTWFPSILTESLFMPVPQHEAALRDPAFLQRLAAAHVAGIERFLLTVLR
jgi:N-acetylmuramoyl-L-alanine amidase